MRTKVLGGALLVAALALAGCSTGASSTGAAAGSAGGAAAGGAAMSGAASSGAPAAAASVAGGSYVFLPKSLNNPYWVDARKGMEAEALKLGVKAQFLGPDTDDAGKQVAIFESILATKPAGIAISPNDPASVKDIIAKARAAGIPVIAWDGPVPNSQVQGYIGTDNVKAGESQAEALAKAMGGSGKVAVVIGSLSATNLNQRLTGLKQGLAKYPGISIVATEESGESIADAQGKAETILQAHPDLTGMAGIGGSDLPGIAGALKAAGKCGKIKAVGFDVVPQGIAGMKGGCVDALISQKPYGMTASALQILVDLNKKTSKLPAAFNVDTGVVTVIPTTLDSFQTSAPH
ncbi:sugar-binding protein [Nakamurella sp. PAMC28650]|jgi:ABC-type sugar transport system substrate-binding protein|uniref:sugar-binding protein n=1 Tax=Nakamurella sp. PAMC28650 TaxID=2762325 RepID=UPI00164D8541|nr:sugar-binding protein [Nakamurella sp. PAMC28650]QNK81015.1 sugar-binding protein [Nakamurella sp. PAMC28650]